VVRYANSDRAKHSPLANQAPDPRKPRPISTVRDVLTWCPLPLDRGRSSFKRVIWMLTSSNGDIKVPPITAGCPAEAVAI
jgi:hypothetical protein